MTEARVVNLRTETYDVYIGRGSKWGNPFRIGQPHQDRPSMTREDVIEAFEDWLLHSDQGVRLRRDLGELVDKRLGCYCAPQACHGDVLLRMLAKLRLETIL